MLGAVTPEMGTPQTASAPPLRGSPFEAQRPVKCPSTTAETNDLQHAVQDPFTMPNSTAKNCRVSSEGLCRSFGYGKAQFRVHGSCLQGPRSLRTTYGRLE